jgi:hypothetical protein
LRTIGDRVPMILACRPGWAAGPDAHRAGRLWLRHADDFDQAHAAIAGDREPLVEAEARNFRARRLAGLKQRVLRRTSISRPSTMS